MFIVLRKRFRDITVTGLLSRVSTATLMRNIDRPIAVLSVRLSVRLYVRLSHFGIVRNSSYFLQYTVAQSF